MKLHWFDKAVKAYCVKIIIVVEFNKRKSRSSVELNKIAAKSVITAFSIFHGTNDCQLDGHEQDEIKVTCHSNHEMTNWHDIKIITALQNTI